MRLILSAMFFLTLCRPKLPTSVTFVLSKELLWTFLAKQVCRQHVPLVFVSLRVWFPFAFAGRRHRAQNSPGGKRFVSALKYLRPSLLARSVRTSRAQCSPLLVYQRASSGFFQDCVSFDGVRPELGVPGCGVPVFLLPDVPGAPCACG